MSSEELSTIGPVELVPLNAFESTFPLVTDVVYANPDDPDNHFKGLYHPDAKIIWAHRDIAKVALIASVLCNKLYGWTLQVNDCLRPVEAQENMAEYGYPPSLVSLPGSGGHPRGMAIDIEPIDNKTEKYVDMGTPFDYFAPDPDTDNPAARNYTKFEGGIRRNQAIQDNRHKLESAMRLAATAIGREIYPLPQEWWDFRFKPAHFEQYAPLRESDVRPYQRMINPDVDTVKKILNGECPEEVLCGLRNVNRNVGVALENIDFNGGNPCVKYEPGRGCTP